MHKLGEIKAGCELGYKTPRGKGKKYIWLACEKCGRERWVQFYSGTPLFKICRFCRAKEVGLSNRGINHPNWKGGAITTKGYKEVKVSPDDFFYPMAMKRGYVLEHRLAVAKALGRCLQTWEIVHHKHSKYPADSIEDKQDNRYPENLQLVTSERHDQITLLENRIKHLEQRVTLLESENILLKTQIEIGVKSA